MTADEEIRITLRMPASLRDLISKAAADAGRSMNNEIVSRLEDTFGGEEKLWGEVNHVSETVQTLVEKLEKLEPKINYLWEKGQP